MIVNRLMKQILPKTIKLQMGSFLQEEGKHSFKTNPLLFNLKVQLRFQNFLLDLRIFIALILLN